MTYEERQLHRELGEALEELRQDLSTGDPSEPLTRAEALRMVELIEAALERVSPERWRGLTVRGLSPVVYLNPPLPTGSMIQTLTHTSDPAGIAEVPVDLAPDLPFARLVRRFRISRLSMKTKGLAASRE